ncbi:MAG: Glucose-methanol-choline (GMC) oxidoreductase:NAD binding site [uncultured Phycisphaerae bacterium]|uniref:Glucose-methanol-choline (GMC) oxidoreductase:NAD binding site n=1 Tax=uncultured Phycisphaerae bacterium TaxID=904963 RepID=A0A6J4PBL4_9BACT|nr:MAG: Glucose-methanol-choline (GMC) oxidoreductase:NAD binding site [uncultured Phycisphaerae bacterium]
MPTISADQAKPEYDVVIVGSGAAGGQAAYTLTLHGLKCCMLEAGRSYDVVNETPMFHRPDQAPLRAAGTPDKPFGFYDATVGGGWEVPGEPYTNTATDEHQKWKWWRARMMGGRTNHWGRISLRNGPYDFKPRSRDGLGFDWPISYEDVEPYYTRVEQLIGVYGTNEGLENTPDSPPGVLLPAPKGRAAELLAQKHAKALGIPVVPVHRAVLTKHLDFRTLPAKLHPGNTWAQGIVREAMAERSACFWATPCGRGCNVGANYQSTTVHLPPALATGNLDIVPSAHCREVTVGKDGRATGVVFIDKTTGKEARVKGKAVVLGASACETVRILLQSRGPGGTAVANSSGLVGKYIMDTVGARLSGHIPKLENLPPHNEDGAGGPHFYAPWWLYKEQLGGKLDFARGYHIEMGGSRPMPGGGNPVPDDLVGRSYGTKLKEDARRYFGSIVGFSARGEMIPNEQCYMDLDPQAKDKWGLPVARFHWKWSDHELNQAVHARRTFAALIEAMGGRVRNAPDYSPAKSIEPPGSIIHEVGGAIMGDDPKRSVCNGYAQTWDVKNLFLVDGAPFASNADKNPTLTIMALAWRAADYLAEQAKKGEL